MFDFSRVKEPDIAIKVREEAETLMGRFHFGVQGIAKTLEDTKFWIDKLKGSGMKVFAFDTEMLYVEEVKKMMEGYVPLHAAVSYPTGRMLLSKKMKDLDRLANLGVFDVCVCLDWQQIFSGNYAAIEKEARIIMEEFRDVFVKNAFVIPATLLGASQLYETVKALDYAGVESIKVNPGAKLGVSFEEVAFINRNFPVRFDIHPSGNIRSLSEVERYLELGCEIIHTASAMDITEAYIEKRIKGYGGTY